MIFIFSLTGLIWFLEHSTCFQLLVVLIKLYTISLMVQKNGLCLIIKCKIALLDQMLTDVYNHVLTMKKTLHPSNYRPVVFQDLNNNETYLTRSTVATTDTIKLDGVEYPLVKVHISSSSHPFFTGEERVLDIEGRVDKFKARAKAAEDARDKRASAAKKQAARKASKEDKADAKASK
jgi:large subunit ribosomal protein L31